MTKTTAQGSPAKDFFIHMITKDISLTDCILDLLDNSIDGARNASKRRTRSRNRLADYRASIAFNKKQFRIEDNCGGIPVATARDYAFHFGRSLSDPSAKPDPGAIGLYGIGMKRAMFKIGTKIEVRSSTRKESFRVPIDVGHWAKTQEPDNWNFDLITSTPGNISRD